MTNAVSESGAQPRSFFVTAAAWLAIIMLVYAILSAFYGIFAVAPASPDRYQIIYTAFFAAAMVAATGLLKRKEWARKLFIGILSFTVPWNLHAAYIAASGYKTVSWSLAVPIVCDIALCALFAWTIYKLCSSRICAEFR